MSRRNRPARWGFTLIEVLVVVAIIALLIAILMPSLNRARRQAWNSQCLANLHQISLGIMTFAAENKDRFPGQSGPLIKGWSWVLAEQFRYRPQGIQHVPVDKLEVFQCPVRNKFLPYPWLGYVHNTMNPDGPGTSPNFGAAYWQPPDWMRTDQYKRTNEVIYIMDAAREDTVYNDNPQPANNVAWPQGPSVIDARVNWQAGPVVAEQYGGIDVMDVRTGSHLPQGKDPFNLSDDPSIATNVRRAARIMHLGRWSNATWMDGHCDRVQPSTLGPAGNGQLDYEVWLRRFGVRNPTAVAAKPIE